MRTPEIELDRQLDTNDALPYVPLNVIGCDFEQGIISDVKRLVAAQQLLIDKEIWQQRGADQKFLRQVASQLLGKDIDPYTYLIGNKTLAKLLTEVNEYFHADTRSRGANSFRKRVIEAQGGEYCVLCGVRSPTSLHVDHIKPVNVGGVHHLTNMQLLCAGCNSAKGSWRHIGIGAILQMDNADEISKLLRYKKLLENSMLENGRTIGRCKCGRTAAQSTLTVEKIRPLFAPTYPNLHVTCGQH